MSLYETQAKIYKTLTHPTRLAILDELRDGEQCVCHLEAMLGLRQAHISQHLMVLRDAGLVADRRDGWNIFYHVSKPEIFAVIEAARTLSGPASGGRARKRPAHACPCPKCNPEAGPVRCDSPEVGVKDVKTAG